MPPGFGPRNRQTGESDVLGSPRSEHFVFISYSHDSVDHVDRVLRLSTYLRTDGITSVLDQYVESPPQGWPRWMTDQIEQAEFVLVICTEIYNTRFRGEIQSPTGLGVKWEGAIITQELYEAQATNTKFIPVLFDEKDLAHIPKPLRNSTYYNVSASSGLESLYRRLTGQPATVPPIVGKRRSMPPREQSTAILEPKDPLGSPDPLATNLSLAIARGSASKSPNPFIWRGGITEASGFFDRDDETDLIRTYLSGKQNCQIVGARRIGKTSFLRHIERIAFQWNDKLKIAYIDFHDARCLSLLGWLGSVAREFRWRNSPPSLSGFVECTQTAMGKGEQLVLCLDEFEELTLPSRRAEFTRDFFLTLRYTGQQGMSILTCSQRRLCDLVDQNDPTSPFYNTFPLLELGPFSDVSASDYVTLRRENVPAFTAKEKRLILEFAQGHPLALQVACFHAVNEKTRRGNLTHAFETARNDMRCFLPNTAW
jgi:SEFIR domain